MSLCCTVHEIDRIEDLQGMAGEWSALWDRCPDATPFQAPEWLLPWWSHLFGGGEMWTLALYDAGALVGIAPMFLFGERGQPRTLVFMGSGITDYMGFLLAEGADPEPIWQRMEQLASRWDICDLQEIPAGAPMLSGALRSGWDVTPSRCAVCPVLDLPRRVGELEERLSPGFRHNLRNARRWIERHCAMETARPDQDAEFIEALFRLHTARWQGRNEPGMLSTGPLRDFFREMCGAFRRRGWLRLHGIRVEGELRAVVCVFLVRGRAHYYLGGFDDLLARHSPGAALLHYAIEHAIAEGAGSFDFLRKREDYKYRWGALDRFKSRH